MIATLTLLSLFACTDKDGGSDTGTAATGGTDGGTDGGAVAENMSCDPLVTDHCGMPWPSTFFMEQDSSTPTGWRVAMGETLLPVDIDGNQPAPGFWNERDGFSPMSSMVVLWPGVSLDGVIGLDDLAAYEGADVKTVIVDVDTGQRVPHFVELDMTADDVSRRVLMLRPVQPLAYGHRYVVGMRGFVDDGGTAIPASDAFLSLRDSTTLGDARVDDRQDLYDTVVFPALEAEGWSRDEVQLAWDFVTGSKEGITGRLVWMRDDMLDRVGDGGPSYVVDEVIEPYSEAFGRVIKGTMTVPMYTESDRPPTLLTRDDDGMPFYNGDVEVPFVVAIPQTLLDDPRPAPLVQYGHGFFGEYEEAFDTWADWNEELASENGWIYFAAEWTGMKAEDQGYVALMVASEIESFVMLPDRSQQGFVEFMALARLMKGDFASDSLMQIAAPDSKETVAIADTSRLWYYGISQGGILGGAYIAASPDIERAAFSVSGMPFSFITTRSKNFDPDFFTLFRTMYPDPADVGWYLGALQTVWDPADPAGYAATLNGDPLQGTPDKQILMQIGVGDAQVPAVSGHIQARGYGASLIDQPVRDVFGLDTQPNGWTGHAVVEWDYGVEDPTDNTPASNDVEDVHDNVRHEATSMEQLVTFFETGEVHNTCDGGCDPE